ncbi:MAG: 4-hydroxy-tetrahydrodipicolinate reductase [Acidimicrobiales bacterium]
MKVGVFGAGGRMGRAVCAALAGDPALELVAAVDPAHAGEPLGTAGLTAAGEAGALTEAGAEVAVDFTVASAAIANALWCAAHGVHAVVGTTGFGEDGLCQMREAFEAGPANCVVAPNFAIGAVLMMRFAELAAPWFETAEVVELHHDAKLDAPSGTALLTARRIAAARAGGAGPDEGREKAPREMVPREGVSEESAARDADAHSGGDRAPTARGMEAAPGVRVHSVRLRGLVAHQEVLFGSPGQVLTLRHDSLERSSFMPGVLLAVKEVPRRRGFTLGLDTLLAV